MTVSLLLGGYRGSVTFDTIVVELLPPTPKPLPKPKEEKQPASVRAFQEGFKKMEKGATLAQQGKIFG